MEDDEEYSYSGYSAETAAQIRRNTERQTLVGDEEEYSFGGFGESSEAYGENAATQAAQHSYGDFLVEEFSAEETAKKVKQLTKLSETTVNYILSAIYFIIGVLCVALASYIANVFSYIVGGFMAVIGVGQFIFAIRSKEYVHTNSNKTAMSLILIALAVLILVEKESAYVIITIAWGFLGLLEAAHAFNHAFSRIARSERCAYYLVKGLIELLLAFLLLYEPTSTHHLLMHIQVFGVNLIFDAVTMFPPLKKFLSKK